MSRQPVLSYRTIPEWPDPPTPANHRQSRYTFKATADATRRKLIEEARHLNASDVIVEVVADTEAFYRDGTGIRSDRAHRVKFPGVIVRLIGTAHGDLRYACDGYETWEASLRAVVLGLNSLRAVERYGIATRGEQYVGWQALPPGTPMGSSAAAPEKMTVEYAAAVLAGGTDGLATPASVIGSFDEAQLAYRVTAKRYHPDRGGSDDVMAKVNAAWVVLVEHHGRDT